MMNKKILSSILVLSLITAGFSKAESNIEQQQIALQEQRLKDIIDTDTKIKNLGINIMSDNFADDIQSKQFKQSLAALSISEKLDLTYEIRYNLYYPVDAKIDFIIGHLLTNNLVPKNLNISNSGASRLQAKYKQHLKNYRNSKIGVFVTITAITAFNIVSKSKSLSSVKKSAGQIIAATVAGLGLVPTQYAYIVSSNYTDTEEILNELNPDEKIQMLEALTGIRNNIGLFNNLLEETSLQD